MVNNTETVWISNLDAVERKVAGAARAIHSGVVQELKDSIVQGSAMTGSPGQPVDLREGQWTVANESEFSSVIGTNEPSAQSVESGVSHFNGAPITLHAPVGGTHSVALTHQNAAPVIKQVIQRVTGNA